MHLAWVIFTLVCLARSQRELSSTFYNDVLCDLTERINRGCSMERVTSSLIQCLSLCGRNKACVGTSFNDQGMCFTHLHCPAVVGCTNKETSHRYMAKTCIETVSPLSCVCRYTTCHARTCSEWRERGYASNTNAIIDPDGPAEDTLDPMVVFCDMTSSGGIGVTVVGHDRMARTLVNGYEDPGSYRVILTYNNITLEQVVSLVESSQQCEQYIKWECHCAFINDFYRNKHFTGWLNRHLNLTDYMGGASPGTIGCGCKVTGNCTSCYCDSNSSPWQYDDGYLTYKDDLPMLGFVAGDTGSSYEAGYHTLGELKCYGSV